LVQAIALHFQPKLPDQGLDLNMLSLLPRPSWPLSFFFSKKIQFSSYAPWMSILFLCSGGYVFFREKQLKGLLKTGD
jgi:hypothetical protein